MPAVICTENEEKFRRMTEETFDTISVMINHKKLQEHKKRNADKKGTVDMCRALDEMMEDSEIQGKNIGRQLGRQEGEKMFAMLVGKLCKDGRISDVQIAALDEEKRKKLYREYGLED